MTKDNTEKKKNTKEFEPFGTKSQKDNDFDGINKVNDISTEKNENNSNYHPVFHDIDIKEIEKNYGKESKIDNSMKNIEWYLEEAEMVIDKYRKNLFKSTINNAERLLPYFQEALSDINPEVREFAQAGIKAAEDVLSKRYNFSL